MVVKYKGTNNSLALLKNKMYEVISIELGYYRIVDETNEDYLYPPDSFEIIDDTDADKITKRWRLKNKQITKQQQDGICKK